MMKKIYLDSIDLPRELIESVLQILYNLIVFNWVGVEEYKFSFDKHLNRQFLVITDPDISSWIKIDIGEIADKIEKNSTNQFTLIFRIYYVLKSNSGNLFALLKKKKNLQVFEDYFLPINIIEKIPINLEPLNQNLSEKIDKVVQNLASEETNFSLT